MDLAKMIAELQDERNRLDEAIEALERLSGSVNRRRGRPPRSSYEAGHPEDVSQAPPEAAKASASGKRD